MTAPDKGAAVEGETLADLCKQGLADWYDSDVTCEGKDIYRDLRSYHKTDFKYDLEWCRLRDEYYVVRRDTSKWAKKRDPGYFSLSHPDWYGEEYTVTCTLPKFAVANPWTLSETFLRKCRGIEMQWVSIEDRIHETPVLDDVLGGMIDKFNLFGLDLRNPLKKRAWKPLSAVNINKKRKILYSELRRVLSD